MNSHTAFVAAMIAAGMFALLLGMFFFGNFRRQKPALWRYVADIDRAGAMIRRKEYDEAEALLAPLAGKSDAPLHIYQLRAAIAQHKGDWVVAARHWKAARRYFPDDALGFAGGARVLLRAGRRAEAVRMLEGARNRVHNPSQLTKVLAEAAQSAGDWAEAALLWEQVRKEAAGDIDSYVRGHECLLAAGRPDEAAAVLADGAMRFPRDPQIVRAMAASSGAPPGAPGPA